MLFGFKRFAGDEIRCLKVKVVVGTEVTSGPVGGPDVPHIGWQTPGKGKAQQSGHILLDEVPAGRSSDKLDKSQF